MKKTDADITITNQKAGDDYTRFKNEEFQKFVIDKNEYYDLCSTFDDLLEVFEEIERNNLKK